MIVYSTVFFLILAAASTTVSILFLPVLLLFIIGSIFAMIAMNIQREFEIGKNRGLEPPRGVFDPSFTAYAVTLSTITISMTFFIFMVLPRMEAGLLHRKDPESIKVVGFSAGMDLGAIGPVKKDPRVVMRVDFPGLGQRPRGPIYFRGTTLSYFDGRGWKKGLGPERIVLRGRDGFVLGTRPRGVVREARVLLEPMDSNVLFTPSGAVRITGRFGNLWEDPWGTVYLPAPPFSRMEYRVWYSPAARRPAEGPAQKGYLDLSRLDRGLARRIRALAEDVTRGASGVVERATLLRNYLRANYTYTLDPRRDPRYGPVEDFLFHSREGFCEHFATAFVLMARSLGIPARIVTGFLEGEWNAAGGYFIVRQSDAHSWAEVYAGRGPGWVRADATPPEGLSPLAQGSGLSEYIDYLRLKWNRYVVNFSRSDQERMASSLEERGRRAARTVEDLLGGLGRGQVPREALLWLLLVLLMALYVVRIRQRRGAVSAGRAPAFYLEMLRVLGRKGLEKDPAETPMEFARRVGLRGVRELTEMYERTRFGATDLGPSEEMRVRGIMRSLRRSGPGPGGKAGQEEGA